MAVLAAASIGSALIALLISLLYLSELDFYLVFMFIAGTVITLSPFLSKFRRLKNRVLAAVFFMVLPVLTSLILLILTGSMKVFLMALSATISVGLCYLLLLTFLNWLLMKTERRRLIISPGQSNLEGLGIDIKTQESS